MARHGLQPALPTTQMAVIFCETSNPTKRVINEPPILRITGRSLPDRDTIGKSSADRDYRMSTYDNVGWSKEKSGDQCAQARATYRALGANRPRVGRQSGTLHAAFSGNDRSGAASLLPPVLRRLRRVPGDGRTAWSRAWRLQSDDSPRYAQTHGLEYSGFRFRHGPVGRSAGGYL